MKARRHGILERVLALCLCASTGPQACVPAPIVTPASGSVEYRAYGQIPVPGGFVDAVGGNLRLSGVGISSDTPLGALRVEPTWNAASGAWQWSHLVRYDGAHFTDASGAVLDVGAVADGSPIPGTGWTRVDATTLRTRGGLDWHFRSDGSLEHVRWHTLDHPRIRFEPAEISQCTAASACSPVFRIEVDASGQPRSVSDARTGRAALFDYDAAGRLLSARGAADVARGRPGTRYEYAGSQLVALTRSEGERIEYDYQAGGRIRRVVQRGEGDPEHRFDFYGRNAWGEHRTVHRNPLGGHTHYYYDESRRVLRVERFEAGENVSLSWDGFRPTRIVDAAGAATQLAWQDERVTRIETPAGNVVRYSYQPGGLSLEDATGDAVLRVEDSLGLVEARSYDASGRPIAVQNGAGETRALSWNGASLAGLDAGGVAVSFPLFGVHGHWLDAWAGGEVIARRAFDPTGNETVPADALRPGGTLDFTYDADRRIASVDAAASDDVGRVVGTARIDVTRRSDGEISAIARPGGGDHELVRDALGRVVRIRERAQGAWHDTRIELDAQGHETARELANGMRQEWEYDVFGRMVRHRARRGGVLEGEETFAWQSGRLVARSDSLRGGGEVVLYDAAGRIGSVVFGYGETISYSYDARDRLVGEVYSVPGAGVVADLGTEYDGANRRVALVDRARAETLIRWRIEDGRTVEIDTGNGLRRTIGYDPFGRVASLRTCDAQGTSVEETSVSRELASGPSRLEIRSATTTPLAATEERYWLPPGSSLANPDQRVGKRVFGWSNAAGVTLRFAWDALGNPETTADGDVFVYDGERARLVSATLAHESAPRTYAWDASGFATSRGGMPLTWTATGRLASHGADRIDWDMAGRPIRLIESGVTREFLLFGGRVESTRSTLGALDLGDVVLQLGSGARRWRHFDFRDQVSFVSDENGAVVAHYRYRPFGVDAAFGPEAGAGRFENRPAFGPLYLLGERVLDPSVGRWLSPDPVLQLGSAYAYALGNPLDFEDADGLTPQVRAALAQAASVLDNGGKIVAAVGLIAGGGALTPGFAITAGVMVGTGAAIRIYLIVTEGSDSRAPKTGPTRDGKVTIIDLPPGAAYVGVTATGVGCAPLALTRDGDELTRLLVGILALDAVVACIWWRRARRAAARVADHAARTARREANCSRS